MPSATAPSRRLLLIAFVLLAPAACREGEPGAGAEVEGRPPSGAVFEAALEAVLPSVVFVEVEARTPLGAFPLHAPGAPPPRTLVPVGAGSGFIFREDGYVLTNAHVVREAERVTVTLYDRRQLEARVVAVDPSTDVAVLSVEAEGLPAAELGESEAVDVGEWVLAVGSPLGLLFTATAGIVGAKGRAIGILGEVQPGVDPGGAAPLEHFIQTDAAINPGNSGGPLVDLAGRVVGINTAIVSPTGLFSGVGFAIPIDLAERVAADLLEFGYVRRPFLGVLLENVDPADAEVYGLEAAEGAEVIHVAEGSPADRAGLRLGDVVLGVAGEPVGSVSDLQAALARQRPGATVPLAVIRYGREEVVPVELGVIRAGGAPAPPPPLAGEAPGIGFSVTAADGGVAVAAVRPFSRAARAGVRPGQRILAVNRREVDSVGEFVAVVRALDSPVLSLIVEDPALGRTIINYRLEV